MGRIVAIGGGELDTTHRINRYIVELSGKKNPQFLFIGTASRDSESYIECIREEFEKLGCVVKCARLISQCYTDEQINALLNQADIIYVGGGDTAFMMDMWRKYALADKLKRIYETNHAVLSGISAGAMCWFSYGHSDSPLFCNSNSGGYGWIKNLLGLLPYAFCPHYNERKEFVDKMVSELDLPIFALENNVALVEEGGQISFVSSDNSSKAYLLKQADGRLSKEAVVVTL